MSRSYPPKKHIGLDLDGVIIDHTDLKIQLSAERGFLIGPKETPSDILKTLLPGHVYEELQRHLYEHLDIALSAPLMPGALEGLRAIAESDVPYALISARGRNHAPAIELLKKHGLWGTIFKEPNTYFVQFSRDKEKCVQTLGISHYVDDTMEVLNTLPSVPNKILFDYLDVFSTAAYLRATSWDALVMMLLRQ